MNTLFAESGWNNELAWSLEKAARPHILHLYRKYLVKNNRRDVFYELINSIIELEQCVILKWPLTSDDFPELAEYKGSLKFFYSPDNQEDEMSRNVFCFEAKSSLAFVYNQYMCSGVPVHEITNVLTNLAFMVSCELVLDKETK